jgi:putative endonuclease
VARERPFIAVYIMASGKHGTLYVGVTSNLWARVLKHKQGQFEGFSRKYGCTGLVWFERHHTLPPAFQRETRVKGWRRRWKLDLIEAFNPDWRDLAANWYHETTSWWLLEPGVQKPSNSVIPEDAKRLSGIHVLDDHEDAR